ncbi:hypothetical protein GEMRC1_007674 [Eukaryota sp. GEM-RC1]
MSFKVPAICLIHKSTNVELCISNLPLIIQISEIGPLSFQYFGDHTILKLQIFGQYFEFYSKSQWSNSIAFNGSSILDMSVLPNVLNFKISVSERGQHFLTFKSSSSDIVSEFFFKVDNFVSFPSVVPSYSKFSVAVSQNFNNLMLFVDSFSTTLQDFQFIPIQNPFYFVLGNDLNSIPLDIKIMQLSLPIPPVIGVNFNYHFNIDLSEFHTLDQIELFAPECELIYNVHASQVQLDLFSVEPGIKSLILEASFNDLKCIKEESFNVIKNPVFKLNSSQLINLSNNSNICLTGSSIIDNSLFSLNHSIPLNASIDGDTIQLGLQEAHLIGINHYCPKTYNIFWDHVFFNEILIDSLTVCNCDVTSASSLSVIESRMIEINLNCRPPDLEFACVVFEIPFTSEIIHHSSGFAFSNILCVNAYSPIYQPFVDVSVNVDDSINFITTDLRVDAQFADVCFVVNGSLPRIPIVVVLFQGNSLSSSYINPLLTLSSGVRCCDNLNCFVTLNPDDTLAVSFEFYSDVRSISVSFLSDCLETRTSLPFFISIQSDLIESVICSPFPEWIFNCYQL